MVELTSTKLFVAVGGLALSLTTGVGVASADPDISPLINTTCSYSQAMAALKTQAPDAASQLSAEPVAQAWLQTLLGSPAGQRQQMIEQVQTIGAVRPYVGLALQVADTCQNY